MNLTRLSTWRWGAGVLLAGIAVLSACDGENLFDTDNNPFITPQIQISAPDGAFAGDTIGIAVSATAAVELATIAVSIRGAITKDTTIITASERSVSALVKVALPEILTDTLIFISAIATDRNGNVSRVRADTVSVLGPPAIVSVTGADSLSPGQTATLRIRAFGTRRITQMDITMRGAVNRDTTIFIVPAVNDASVNLPITIPAAPTDTSVRVTIVARDVTGLSSAPTTTNVPLRVAAPNVILTAPATAVPGGILDLTVSATAMRGVRSIRVQLSGAATKDTVVAIVPARSPVTENIQIRLPGNITDPTLTVRAFATDQAGTVSLPATATVTLSTAAPVIVSVTGPDSVRAGGTVDIRVTAQGVAPIKELLIQFRGAVDRDIRVAIDPARANVVEDVSVQIPVDVSATTLTVTAIAIDESNVRSALTPQSTKTIQVSDVTAPTATVTVTPATTAAGGTILIRVGARDNVSVTRIGYAVVNPAGDTVGVTPTLVTTSGAVKDTTFSFIVPATITPRTVRVFGIALDASGRRGISPAVSVVIADSAAPAITINAPAANATLPLNDSVRVNVRVQDPTGIKEIRLIGQSTRVDSLGPTRVITRFAEKVITFPISPGAPLPTDTTITRYLLAIPDSISEPVQIIVTASDSIGNSAAATTTILVGGPRVELRNPVNNAQVTPGGTLPLTAFAVDRSAGIDSVQFTLTGAQNAIIKYCGAAHCQPLTPSNDSVLVNHSYVVGAATGTVTITATAWNRNRVAGQSSPVAVLVSTTAVTDAAPPQVRVAMTANDRVELADTIVLNVAAQDVGAAGLRRMGVVVMATPGGTGVDPDTLYLDSVFTGTGRTGLQPASFKFTLADFGFTEATLIRLPRSITLQVHAFAVDTIGNSGCNVTNTLAALPCDSIMPPQAPAKFFITRNNTPPSQLVTVVPGFSRGLPTTGSLIADILVDTTSSRPRLFLSNHNNNRVDVLELNDSTFAEPVNVGSEPWGLFINNANSRLIVANSGGTNISFVNTLPGPDVPLAEVANERLLTPNAVLYDITTSLTNSQLKYSRTFLDFSDRPQFVAQDVNGVILYSTKPTGASPDGSVRYIDTSAARKEPRILFNRTAITPTTDGAALAHVDSVVIERNTDSNDRINIFDHIPGTTTVIQSGFMPDVADAVANVRAQGSDVEAFAGVWNRDAVGLSDTTFVAASGNRQFVGFGEGAVGPFAEVWLWRAADRAISDDIAVSDLVGNASERVLGIALNRDGSIGGARGATAAYFFSNDVALEGDLRLQGIFSSGIAGGNGGIALDPLHQYDLNAGSNSRTLAYVATVNRSIKIVDTFHFRDRGEIQIRDNIVGPLRAALPAASENAGPDGVVGTGDDLLLPGADGIRGTADDTANSCDAIWVKLYGITGANRAVIINVRAKDIVNPIITGTACPS